MLKSMYTNIRINANLYSMLICHVKVCQNQLYLLFLRVNITITKTVNEINP